MRSSRTWTCLGTGREARGSRSQAVFLRSMATQHPALKVRVIDVPHLTPQARARRVADWQLTGLEVVSLEQAGRGGYYGQAPVTVLTGPDGRVVRRWDGFAAAAELDRAIAGGHPAEAISPLAPP